ncbi:MAG: hypothetical protein K9M94_04490 [Spirochaetia bacterium]|nr:hypothetical protein [Spirochaetia bacterium]
MTQKNSTIILSILFLLGLSLSLMPAQSNQIIDQLLEKKETSFAEALYLVQTATGEIPEDISPQIAAERFDSQGWNLPQISADTPITLGEYSQLLMHAFEIPGGIMYSIFPGPRYAAREAHYRGFVRGSALPGRSLSGSEVLFILRQVLEWKEESA